ncbi:hypothetical protein BGX31_009740 [Mortierella sp. GBA43]|nr:hypothetical protein BGX31_009740 [Mortierella sp. GBA43]
MKRRDALHTADDEHSNDITPETIGHLLKLAHLRKPEDPEELLRLERDVRRIRNFLDYIRTTDKDHPSTSIESLRSLVDDGEGLRLRSSVPTTIAENQQELERRRDALLRRPSQVKGNFFVVPAALDPKEDS